MRSRRGASISTFFPSLLSSLTCMVSLLARRHRFWRSLCLWFFVRRGRRGSSRSSCCCCSPPREDDDKGLMPASADGALRLASVAAPAPAAPSAPVAVSRRPIATTSGPSLSSSISKRRNGGDGERDRVSNQGTKKKKGKMYREPPRSLVDYGLLESGVPRLQSLLLLFLVLLQPASLSSTRRRAQTPRARRPGAAAAPSACSSSRPWPSDRPLPSARPSSPSRPGLPGRRSSRASRRSASGGCPRASSGPAGG